MASNTSAVVREILSPMIRRKKLTTCRWKDAVMQLQGSGEIWRVFL
jgi:hypothetical protein